MFLSVMVHVSACWAVLLNVSGGMAIPMELVIVETHLGLSLSRMDGFEFLSSLNLFLMMVVVSQYWIVRSTDSQ